ncbi:MAG: GNAT family N-acetyltransferase [Candidatus Omnitrophica bacterium]|nr:GNAT family N-acetyltransferase [Candidatus Omnitrophota bacterium]
MAQNNEITVRFYKKEDKDIVRDIAVDTAFLGKSGEIFLPDRQVLADMLTAYYLDYEPESVLVAEYSGKVVGYLMGCVDTLKSHRITDKNIMPVVIRKGLRRGLLLKIRTLRFAYFSLRSLIRKEFSRPDFNQDYPAHFHINISEGFRGKGAGHRLLEAFCAYLKGKNIKGACAWTFTEGGRKLFSSCGFNELYCRGVTYFDYLLEDKLFLSCWGRKL